MLVYFTRVLSDLLMGGPLTRDALNGKTVGNHPSVNVRCTGTSKDADWRWLHPRFSMYNGNVKNIRKGLSSNGVQKQAVAMLLRATTIL
jgi:hypothetical protein